MARQAEWDGTRGSLGHIVIKEEKLLVIDVTVEDTGALDVDTTYVLRINGHTVKTMTGFQAKRMGIVHESYRD
jgi:hypothetical protein